MRILDVSINPNMITYYVQYNLKQDKLVQYIAETYLCVNQIHINKYTYRPISNKRVKTIKEWTPSNIFYKEFKFC